MSRYYIAFTDVPSWLAKLSAEREVFAPVRQGEVIVYRPYTEGEGLELALRPTESAKKTVFPRSEELFSFRRKASASEEIGSGRVLSVTEAPEPAPTLVFGALPCDVRGFFTLDPVYNGSGTQGIAKDVYYLRRREQTLFIAKACTNTLSTCFCHWVGGSPTSTDGADALAVPIADGFVISSVTDKGQEVLFGLQEASADQMKAADTVLKNTEEKLENAPDLTKVKEGLLSHFEDKNFWHAESAQCLSCGTCTYLCPTCYCFNITDETNGMDGVRLRSWDTCMASLFTLEASGHNPRTGKADRLRNRVGHKFSYYPNIHGERFACVGCGRCIKSCPSMVDIRQIVLNALNQKEAVNG